MITPGLRVQTYENLNNLSIDTVTVHSIHRVVKFARLDVRFLVDDLIGLDINVCKINTSGST